MKWTPEQEQVRATCAAEIRGLLPQAVRLLKHVLADGLKVAEEGRPSNSGQYPANMHMEAVKEICNRGGLPARIEADLSADDLPRIVIDYAGTDRMWHERPQETAQ